jgi:hypothetical protein
MKLNTSSTPVKAGNPSHQTEAHNAWAYYKEIFGELYDGFDLLVAEGRAISVVAEARGVPQSFIDNEDHEDFNRIQDEAVGILEATIKSIVAQPGCHLAAPDFWDRVISEVCRSLGVAPRASHVMIRSHIEMLHSLAKAAGVDGVLTLTRIDDKGNVHTERFAIGDVENHVSAAIGWSTHPGLNLYIPWAIFRKDMPHWSKGGEEHVVAALAFVGDLDADTGKAGTGLDGLPLASPYVIETSAGNYQPVFPLARPLFQEQAKPIAVALGDAVGADSRTKDTSSLFRIAGTLNWPSKKKLERGRSAVPQLVTIKTAWTGDLVEPEAIQEAVKDFVKPQRASVPANSGSTVSLTETFDDLPAGLQKQIASPAFEGEDQSRTAASVFSQLWRRGWSRDAIQALIEQYPHGVGKRYANGKKDLSKDIARSCEKFEA